MSRSINITPGYPMRPDQFHEFVKTRYHDLVADGYTMLDIRGFSPHCNEIRFFITMKKPFWSYVCEKLGI